MCNALSYVIGNARQRTQNASVLLSRKAEIGNASECVGVTHRSAFSLARWRRFRSRSFSRRAAILGSTGRSSDASTTAMIWSIVQPAACIALRITEEIIKPPLE
jgi:hypothetical protein